MGWVGRDSSLIVLSFCSGSGVSLTGRHRGLHVRNITCITTVNSLLTPNKVRKTNLYFVFVYKNDGKSRNRHKKTVYNISLLHRSTC